MIEVSVGCYPEGHPDTASPRVELEHLKRKVDAGATRCITQYFFDTDVYFRFLDRARSAYRQPSPGDTTHARLGFRVVREL